MAQQGGSLSPLRTADGRARAQPLCRYELTHTAQVPRARFHRHLLGKTWLSFLRVQGCVPVVVPNPQ